MLNDAPSPQRAEMTDALDPQTLGRFAQDWRDRHRRQWLTTSRLADGCVLLRRPLFEEVNGPSIRSMADLGAAIRARGFELAVARDLFVYHEAAEAEVEPPRVTASPVIDSARLVPKGALNLPSRMAAQASRKLGQGPRPQVSLTMIVRDEEENLAACLASDEGLCDEVVVVDTGSTDRTVEVARSLGAKVVSFPWVDDFAAARNAALDEASGRYAFWLDADDRIDEENRHRLGELFRRLDDTKPSAYVMRQLSTGREGRATTTAADHVRLFPLREDVRWSYRVHEQIVPAIRAAGIPVEWTEIGIGHVGYIDDDLRDKKLERNFGILRLELREKPTDPFVLFNIGWVAIERKEPRTALGYLRASLAASSPRDSIVRKVYLLIARAYQMLGDPGSALAACVAGRELDPDDTELLFREGLLRRERGDLAGAESCWRRILEAEPPRKFTSLVSDLRGHLTRRHLAQLAEQRGDRAGALRLWDEVLTERPEDAEASLARTRLASPSCTIVVSAVVSRNVPLHFALFRLVSSRLLMASARTLRDCR